MPNGLLFGDRESLQHAPLLPRTHSLQVALSADLMFKPAALSAPSVRSALAHDCTAPARCGRANVQIAGPARLRSRVQGGVRNYDSSGRYHLVSLTQQRRHAPDQESPRGAPTGRTEVWYTVACQRCKWSRDGRGAKVKNTRGRRVSWGPGSARCVGDER